MAGNGHLAKKHVSSTQFLELIGKCALAEQRWLLYVYLTYCCHVTVVCGADRHPQRHSSVLFTKTDLEVENLMSKP